MMVGNAERIQPKPVENRSDLDMKDGWAFPKIRDILEINYGKGLKKAKRISGSIPVYGSNGVVGAHNVGFTQGPTIIIGRKGTVGAVSFSDVPCWPIDTTYFIDEFNDLDPKYIVYALKGLKLAELDTSTAIPGLNRNDLYGQPIPLAPLAEQKRIVTKVEELLARVKAARERLDKVKEILKRFRQSVLAAACSGRLTADWREKISEVEPALVLLEKVSKQQWKLNIKTRIKEKLSTLDISDPPQLPAKWEWAMVGEISDKIHYGYTAKSQNEPIGPKLLRITDIQKDKVNWEIVPYCKIDENKKPKYILRIGDLVFARTGATVGKSYLLGGKFPESVFASYLIRIIVNERISKEFISIFFKSSSYWRQITTGQVGIGQPNVNAQILSKIILPLPPGAEQLEIVSRVEALFNVADAIETRVEVATAHAEKLTQAILSKAYRGELVPTEAELARREDHVYESASVLIAKIKAQRKDAKPKRKHKPAKNNKP